MARLAVCSWSLQPTSPAELAARTREAGLRAVQLALDPIRTGAWDEHETRRALAAAGVAAVSGMMAPADEDYTTLESIRHTGGVRPAGTWDRNRAAAAENARLARRLGLALVTLHAGHVPGDEDPHERDATLRRLGEIVEIFAGEHIRIAFETGQETPERTLDVLARLAPRTAGVNFDPANILLYGSGEPLDAFEKLAPHVRQVHVKDAVPPAQPGAWGEERVVGSGAVDWDRFLERALALTPGAILVIEREWGDRRVDDVRTAAGVVGRRLARLGEPIE